MIRLIDEIFEILENEGLQEKYKDIYEVISKMKKSRELDEESNKLNKEINEYLQNNKEEK
jgi:hypothetical protein